MIRNLLVFVLFATSSCVVLYGQTPAPKVDKDNAPKVFAWYFDGDGGYLGVQTQEVNKENFAKFGLRDVRGVAVEKVMENSPAAAAGLQNGDVIVRFNGEEVTSTRKLTRLISEVAPDHEAKVTVLRGGSERDITVTVGKRPAPKFENGNFEWRTPMPMGQMPAMPPMGQMPAMPPMGQMPEMPRGDGNFLIMRGGAGRQIGVGLSPLGKQLGDYFGVADGNGLLINSVRENSPAAKAGLKAGDVIVEVDGKAVKGDFDLMRVFNEKKEGDVELTIVRDRNRQTIRVTPEAMKGDLGPMFEKFDGAGPIAPMRVKPMQPGAVREVVAPPAPMTLAMPGRVL